MISGFDMQPKFMTPKDIERLAKINEAGRRAPTASSGVSAHSAVNSQLGTAASGGVANPVGNAKKTRPPPQEYYWNRHFEHRHERGILQKGSAEDGIPRQNTIEALHRAVSALDKKEVGKLLLCGANVNSTFEGLTLAQRVEMARRKIAPGDSGRKEALEWIVTRLNANGAGIVTRSKEQQDEADRSLHSAVSMLDWHLAVRALEDGADVHSVINGDTLKARIERRKKQFEEKKDRMPRWKYNSERAGLKAIIIGLRNQGADVPEPGPWLDRQPPLAGKGENADMHLHAAVESLDLEWAGRLLGAGTDVHTIIGDCTLRQRIEQMRNDVNSPGSQFGWVVRERRKQPALIEEMATLLRAHGADV